SALQRLIAHPQVVAQRVAERVEFFAPGLHLCQLSRQQVAHVAASRPSRVRLVADQIANLTERQAMGLRLLDEPDAVDGPAVVLAKPARRAARSRKESLPLVVTERISRETADSREVADP